MGKELRLALLGDVEVRRDGVAVAGLTSLKSLALLCFLAVTGRPHFRPSLAGLLWGDLPEEANAQNNLRKSLSNLRRLVGPHLSITRRAIAFNRDVPYWLDVEVFETQVRRASVANAAPGTDVKLLQEAVELCRGDFLEGFYVRQAPAFEEWALAQRARLRELALQALHTLVVHHTRRGKAGHAAGVDYTTRLLALDPWREEAHRQLMVLLARSGQRSAALARYETCRQMLADELAVEPGPETKALYERIRDGKLAGAVARPPATVLPRSLAPGPPDTTAVTPFVGREDELAFLWARWQQTTAGRGGLILVHGEAGVGKTRLVAEFARKLHQQGAQILWGRCCEFERVLPYQPFAEALRAVLRALTPTDLARFPAWIVHEIGRLVPEILEAEPGVTPEELPGLEEARERRFNGIARFMALLCDGGPVLLVLEDLHWATESTLQLLHYLVRSLAGHRVLIIGTIRPEAVGECHPLRGLEQRLERDEVADRMVLPRLSGTDVETLVATMSGAGDASRPLAQRIFWETEGNPFFIVEVVKSLFESTAILEEKGRWSGDLRQIADSDFPLPARVSEAVQARVARRPPDARETLSVAAVLGREFDFGPLDSVLGKGDEATLVALDLSLQRGLLEEGPGPAARDYVFSHHLVQEVIYAGLSRRRRQRTHARVGEAMEHVYKEGCEAIASELARHFLEGRHHDEALTVKAIAYLQQAGDRARLAYAFHEAIDNYEKALPLLKAQRKSEQEARTLMKLGLCYHAIHAFDMARLAYQDGFRARQRHGAVEPAESLPSAPHALRQRAVEPSTLDPGHADHLSMAVPDIFSGLIGVDRDGTILPDVAERWDILKDGLTYVFHLRDDVRWSDGKPVTAGDYECAWRRLLRPATPVGKASLLFDISGARALHRGKAIDPDQVGIRARDDLTLVVELEEPTAYFLSLLTATTLLPVPKHVVEARGEAWAEPESIVTNGPFRLSAWNPGEHLLLERDPTYHGRVGCNMRQARFSLCPEWPVSREWMLRMVREYDEDQVDILPLGLFPPEHVGPIQQRHPADFVETPAVVTSYLEFDVGRPPFDDRRVRQAFALATDREELASGFLRGMFIAATGGLVAPAIPGHSPGIALPYDPEQACRLMVQAGYPEGRGFPAVHAVGGHAPAAVEYVSARWRETLGVDVTWKHTDYVTFERAWSTMESFPSRLSEPAPRMWLPALSGIVPDPSLFVKARARRAYKGWLDDRFEELVARARRAHNRQERLELYRRADGLLIDEAVVLPFVYSGGGLLIKPWIRLLPWTPKCHATARDVIILPH